VVPEWRSENAVASCVEYLHLPITLSQQLFSLLPVLARCYTRARNRQSCDANAGLSRIFYQNEASNAVLQSSELSDQLVATLKSSTIVKIALTWIHDAKRCDKIKIMPSIQTSLAQSESARPNEGYHAVCVQHVAVSCFLSAKQMATSKQCKVPTKEDQWLDHATKLEASLPESYDPIDARSIEAEIYKIEVSWR
jgi:hypothetical protein